MEILAETNLPTEFGVWAMKVARINNEDVVILQHGEIESDHDCLVRIHSQCFTGESLWSRKCDCRGQLELAMRIIANEGSGIIVYLFQEGRGIGLVEKVKAYALQEKGLDTVEANVALGHEIDARDFGLAVKVLEMYELESVRLMTNNPDKVNAIQKAGFTVTRIALELEAQDGDKDYLRTKKSKLGHMLDGV